MSEEKKNLKIYLIAGEASGDLHGSNLIKALKQKHNNLTLKGFGGDKMQSAGMQLTKHFKDASFMGFVEVLKNLKTIKKLFKICKDDVKSFNPDVVVLIDYPGFNLRMLPFLKKLGTKIVWYISPQVWAWKANRSKILKKYVDELLVILPFEKDFFKTYNLDATFVGHPLLDEIKVLENKLETKTKTIAILPGSRKQEIKKMLPVMIKMVDYYPDYNFKVAALSINEKSFYTNIIKDKKVELLFDQTYDLLKKSDAALVTSGTATLETALHKVPQVVCYKGNPISYLIGKQLIKVKYISLVNLILDKELVKELIQNDFNELSLKNELHQILNTEKRNKILKEYETLIEMLGKSGASEKVANVVLSFLDKR